MTPMKARMAAPLNSNKSEECNKINNNWKENVTKI